MNNIAVPLTRQDVPTVAIAEQGRQSTPARVCVLGAALDVSNRGVLALGVSLAQLIARARPGVDLAFHYSNATGGSRWLAGHEEDMEVQILNCRMSPKSAPSQHVFVILVLSLLYRLGFRGIARRNPWVRSLLAAEFVGDVRGGDSFSDIYGLRRFLEGSLPLISVALLGRSFTLLPQTYGPFQRRSSRLLAKWLLHRAAVILTRDRHCEATVRQLCGRTPRFCPDVAFTLEPIQPHQLHISPCGLRLDNSQFTIGVNVSGLLYMGGYTGRNMFGLQSNYPLLINRLVEQLLHSTHARILLVPHEFGVEQEKEACARIFHSAGALHRGRVFMLMSPLSERELKWVIGQTDFFIGSRMHACIAALSQFVPAVGLAYSDKFLGVFESAGVGQANIDLRTTALQEVIARTMLALQHRAELKKDLEARIPAIQQQVHTLFDELFTPV